MADFLQCLMHTLLEESGERQTVGRPLMRGDYSFSDDADDPGGATMMGVTHRVYNAWRTRRRLPLRDVRLIEDSEIFAIYRENYWQLVRGDELPTGIDLALFDFGVNSGPGRSIMFAQQVLGCKVDGILGAVTMLRLHQVDAAHFIRQFMEARRDYCRGLSNYRSFRGGWETRWNRIETAALSMVATGPAQEQALVESLPPWQTTSAARAVETAPETMAQSNTGNAAAFTGTGGMTQVGMDAAQAAAQLNGRGKPWAMFDLVIELAQRPSFWIGVSIVVGSAYVWLERRRKMRLRI